MTFKQELCDRRVALQALGRKLLQIDFLAGPARSHRRKRSYRAGMGIKPAQRVGLSALRAVGVEQEIVKVPKHEVVVALGRPEALVVRGVDPEKDLAIHQQREETDSRKIVLPPEPADSLRRRQGREDGRNVG